MAETDAGHREVHADAANIDRPQDTDGDDIYQGPGQAGGNAQISRDSNHACNRAVGHVRNRDGLRQTQQEKQDQDLPADVVLTRVASMAQGDANINYHYKGYLYYGIPNGPPSCAGGYAPEASTV